MDFSLIICTYQRPNELLRLLESIKVQSLYPNEIIIIDGSIDTKTKEILLKSAYEKVKYFLISDIDRGLTRQRNFGIKKVSDNSEVICFLDDDTILKKNYFKTLISTYTLRPDALGAGGCIINEVKWQLDNDKIKSENYFYYDGWKRIEGSRFKLRKKLGLMDNSKPGFMPLFSNGRSVSFLPPSGKIYQVEQLMGGVSSFKKSIFKEMKFSTYFQGYGLYEDADFTLRLSKKGKLYINTEAKLEHHHAEGGRPNKFKYGKMVVRNGWYVWRTKHRTPPISAKMKWYLIALLLASIRFANIFNTKNKKEAFTESIGRFFGLFILIFNKPNLQE